MGKEVCIKIQPLHPDGFRPYGHVVAPEQHQPPDLAGEGWACWYPLGELQREFLQQIGVVRSEPGYRKVRQMERHQQREEWVFAIDKPVIQVVSLSDDMLMNRPDPGKTQAFLLQPGQGVQINKGVWHAAGIAPASETVLYGFVLGKENEEDIGIDDGMVPFINDAVVIVGNI